MNSVTTDYTIAAAGKVAKPYIAKVSQASPDTDARESDSYIASPLHSVFNNYDSSGRYEGSAAKTVVNDVRSTLAILQSGTKDIGKMVKKLKLLREQSALSDETLQAVYNQLRGMLEGRDNGIREVFKKAYNVLLGESDPEGGFLEDIGEHLDALEGRETAREAEQEKQRKMGQRKPDASENEDKVTLGYPG